MRRRVQTAILVTMLWRVQTAILVTMLYRVATIHHICNCIVIVVSLNMQGDTSRKEPSPLHRRKVSLTKDLDLNPWPDTGLR